jgi:dihydrofolate synthase
MQNSSLTYRKLGRPICILSLDGGLNPDQISAVVASQLNWSGRLQLVDTSKITGDKKAMLLDGAHNGQAAQALSRHVDCTYRPDGPVVWVIAMSQGKNVREFVSTLIRPEDQVVVTQFGAVDGMPWVRSERSTELAQTIQETTETDVYTETEPWYALRRASELASGKAQVVICGSLYLAGDVLRILTHQPPKELEGPKWEAWLESQRKEADLRREGNFD